MVTIAKDLNSTVTLNDGNVIPLYGLGVYMLEDPDVVTHALRNGHRLLDTAEFYENEASVGVGLRKSGLQRKDVFVVSKVWQHGYDVCIKHFHKTLKRLESGYLDLYLIHHPSGGKILETYDAMLELQKQGLIRSVGVSNFAVHHLEALKTAGKPLPSVNQIELHPFRHQTSVVDYCRKEGIAVMGYSPLARMQHEDDQLLVQLAKKYNKTTPQIMIRWSVQSGFITIPKSGNPQRILDNADVFNFELTPSEMDQLNIQPECSVSPWCGGQAGAPWLG